MNSSLRIATGALLFLACSSPRALGQPATADTAQVQAQAQVQSQAPPQANGGSLWTFVVAPYFMMPHMDGTSTVRGISATVDVGPEEVLEALDFGMMLYLEARDPHWSVSLDAIYMNLGESGTLREDGREVKVDVQETVVELTGLRRVNPWLEAGAGTRLYSIKGGLQAAAGVVLPAVDVEDTETWLDLFVAARFEAPLKGKFKLGLRTDIGTGFGFGSDLAWQIYPAAGYDISSLLTAMVAYRWIDVDYEHGDGTGTFGFDMVTFGPELGLAFHF